jgi:hypothetical protein
MGTLIRHVIADGATKVLQQNLGTIVSDIVQVLTTPVKFGIENLSDRVLGASPFTGLFLQLQQIGDNDGFLYAFTAADAATLSRPWGAGVDSVNAPNGSPAVTIGAGGWAGTAGAKGVVATALNATGETVASVEAGFAIADVSQRPTYVWAPVPGAASYKVYRTDTPGTYPASSLVATNVGNGNTTFVDTGAAPGVGTPPVANTTAGAGPAYGTPPVDGDFNQVDKAIGELAIGREYFYWVKLRVTAGTSAVGNRRLFRIIPKEL